jgi:hypothetical protein
MTQRPLPFPNAALGALRHSLAQGPPRSVSVTPAAALAYIIKEGEYLTLAHLSRYESAARRTLLNALKELDRIVQRENATPLNQQPTAPVRPDIVAKITARGGKLPPGFDKPGFGDP